MNIKSLVSAVALASALAAPAISFAQQSNEPTHAQVRAELVQLEKAGYQPSRNDPHYPADIGQHARAWPLRASRFSQLKEQEGV